MGTLEMTKEVHDALLVLKPEDAKHEEADCPFCNDKNDNTSVGGGDTMTEIKTYTEDELTAAVREAVAPLKEAVEAAEAEASNLKSELESLRADNEAEEIEDQVALAKADTDRAEARAAAAEDELAQVIAWLEEQAQLAEIAEYLEAVKAERLATIAQVAPFSEEYIENNIDRWVAESDEDFAARVEDWKVAIQSSKASRQSTEETPTVDTETAMSHTRTEGTPSSAATLVYAAHRGGTDIRRLNI